MPPDNNRLAKLLLFPLTAINFHLFLHYRSAFFLSASKKANKKQAKSQRFHFRAYANNEPAFIRQRRLIYNSTSLRSYNITTTFISSFTLYEKHGRKKIFRIKAIIGTPMRHKNLYTLLYIICPTLFFYY